MNWKNQTSSVSILSLLMPMLGCMSEEHSYVGRKRTAQIKMRAAFRERVKQITPEIIKMIDQGISKQKIATNFGINLGTVYTYLKEFKRLQAEKPFEPDEEE